MTKFAAAKARSEFAQIVNRAAHGKERIVITKNNKDILAVVPIEDLELLQSLENQVDLDAARKALAETKKKGSIPWNRLKKDLNL